MTKLITIDYTEYLELIRFKNNIHINICEELIDSLKKINNNIYLNFKDEEITKEHLFQIFRVEIDKLNYRIERLKEEVNND